MKPDWTPKTMPDYFELKTGSFLEMESGIRPRERLRRSPTDAARRGAGADRPAPLPAQLLHRHRGWAGALRRGRSARARARDRRTAQCSTSPNPRCGVSRPLWLRRRLPARSPRTRGPGPHPNTTRDASASMRGSARRGWCGSVPSPSPRGLAATGQHQVVALCCRGVGHARPAGHVLRALRSAAIADCCAAAQAQRMRLGGKACSPFPTNACAASRWFSRHGSRRSRATRAPRSRQYVTHDVGGLG